MKETMSEMSSTQMDSVLETLRKYTAACKEAEHFERMYDTLVMDPKISTEEVSLDERVKIRNDWINAYGDVLLLREELDAMLA
jgi:hypothetical protein